MHILDNYIIETYLYDSRDIFNHNKCRHQEHNICNTIKYQIERYEPNDQKYSNQDLSTFSHSQQLA